MLEREVKLGAGPAFHLPDLTGVIDGVEAGRPEAVRMETVYFDTADLRLARWGVSLRHRAGEGWTLKLPAVDTGRPQGDLLQRDEITFQGSSKKPPQEAVDVVRAYVRKADLVPVARLSTLRRRVRLLDAGGSRLAEVVDDEVSVRDGRRVAARFREIEVEVTSKEDAAGAIVEPVVLRLRGAGAGAPDPTPKHIRALGPRAMEPPEVAAGAIKPESPATDVIKSAFAECIASLLRHDPLVRTSPDPEGVHQSRVATRKLRSHLRTFGPLLDAAWADSLRSELGWLAMGLGSVRDSEVLLDRLRQRASTLPETDTRSAASLVQVLAGEVATMRKKLMVELGSPRYVDLLERLVTAAHVPATLPDADLPASSVLPPLAAGPWRRLRSAVRQLPDPPSDPELHRIRILAKRARYAAEAVAPVVGAGAAAFARGAARLQTVLGEHQDSVTAQAWLRRAPLSGRRAFVAGELIAMEHVAAADATSRWKKVWQSLDRKSLREWMP